MIMIRDSVCLTLSSSKELDFNLLKVNFLFYHFAQLFYHYHGNLLTTNMCAFKDKLLNLQNIPCAYAFECSLFLYRYTVVCV